ncbi:unannotated protein [freshwater metagenome]|uniref:Unannotated protein n=1 Tax=freshwater metagenome TaxID=449393 RepID=A0A6J5ZR93_9ZZZZ
MTNASADSTITVASSVGTATKGTLVGSTLPITVKGLSAGESAEITVSTSRAGHTSESNTYTSSALEAGLVPAFGSLTRSATGFSIPVTNMNNSFTVTVSSSVGTAVKGAVSGSNLPITVTGLSSGQSAVLTVTTSRTNYASVTSTYTATSLEAATPGAVATASVVRGKKKATFLWSPVMLGDGSQAGYVVRISKKGSKTKFGDWRYVGSANSAVFKSLKKNGKYVVQVAAVRGAGQGPTTSISFKSK